MKKALVMLFIISFSVVVFAGSQTVYDSSTGFEWQREETKKMDWNQAVAYCKSLSLEGKTDWRLPLGEEEQSLDRVKKKFPIFKQLVQQKTWRSYWHGQSDGPYAVWFYSIDFMSTVSGAADDKASKHHVRCVRKR